METFQFKVNVIICCFLRDKLIKRRLADVIAYQDLVMSPENHWVICTIGFIAKFSYVLMSIGRENTRPSVKPGTNAEIATPYQRRILGSLTRDAEGTASSLPSSTEIPSSVLHFWPAKFSGKFIHKVPFKAPALLLIWTSILRLPILQYGRGVIHKLHRTASRSE